MRPVDEAPDELSLDRDVSTFIQSARRLTRLARALSAVTTELAELQDALAQLHAGRALPQTCPPSIVNTDRDLSPSRPVVGEGPPRRDASAESPVGDESSVSYRPAVPPTPGITLITVTVTETGGGLDLVRVYDALASVAQSPNLSLTKYERSCASIVLSIDRVLAHAAIPDVLRAAFPERVRGEWLSDTEFRATLAPTEPTD